MAKSRYDKNKAKHIEAYVTVRDRLLDFVTRAENASVDVTTLKSQLTTWSGLIKDSQNKYDAFTAFLRTAGTQVCSDRDGFAENLETAKVMLDEFKHSLEKSRDYYKNTIKPSLQDIRGQVGSASSSSQSNP